MYLQKSEEYVSGHLVGSDEEGKLYGGIVCFMIVGLQSNVPYVVRAVPETKISSQWIEEQLITTLDVLNEAHFNVRGVVSDNHPSNVSAYKRLETKYGNSDGLSITYKDSKMYLFHDVVHLAKNIRNNLLGRKRFIFPPFTFQDFPDEIKVPGREISWKTFHDISEKDKNSNLKKAPKINAQVLHPRNCKQSVPPALAIFDETTIAAIKSYFPNRIDAAQFLNLFRIWWIISNSKSRYNKRNQIGHAAILNDKKPKFLRAFADWISSWQEAKIPCCENFQLTAQTSAAMVKTLRSHASLIEDLLDSGHYDYVLTARFQSDPIEKRYGQYRQMSGGRFLVSLREVNCSENIIKMKSLLKRNLDVQEARNNTDPIEVKKELQLLEEKTSNVDPESISLGSSSREVSDYVSGYIAQKLKTDLKGCCFDTLIGEYESGSYVQILSRGGLLAPSKLFGDYELHIASPC